MSDQETRAKVKEMAKLTVLSNRISEVQEKNLKTYPFVFFEGVKAVGIDYDLSYAKTTLDEPVLHNSRVSYYLTIDTAANNEKLEKRFKALENSVRNLFWKDVVVEVYFNDRIQYKSIKNGR